MSTGATPPQTTAQPPRFFQRDWWGHFVRSNYVTWFTEWLLGFGGKSAHVILLFTTLYMSAELYPGVDLPQSLSIAVFLVQMFALDMGGMGLASLARQAEQDGNQDGARSAKRLSSWLIGIMIAGLVTVCLEQAISHIPNISAIQGYVDAAKIVIEVVLVVARAVCAVLYGKVIHALRQEHAQTVAVDQMEQLVTSFNERLQEVQSQLDELAARSSPEVAPVLMQLATLTEQVVLLQSGQHSVHGVTTETPQNEIVSERDCGQEEDAAVDTFVDTGEYAIVNIAEYRREDTNVSTQEDAKTSTAMSTKVSTANPRGDARQKALRILKKYPDIGPTELAKKAQISRSYATRILEEKKGQVVNR